ncbi:hypothetical protein [Actinoplanes sp. G11-F43]|uniref:hypothetical protein n=1 Tax=Actinoplanes sp. G11-F43 TaxID=3424130 RepID=UPI003D33F666
MTGDDLDKLLSEQIAYYRARAGTYDATVEDQLPGQPAPAVRRTTAGLGFRAVKVLHDPGELRSRLTALGWTADIETVGWRFLAASLHRAHPGPMSPVQRGGEVR